MSRWSALKAGDVSRRTFLRGGQGTVVPAQRPPWAKDEESFINSCTACGDCISACPEGVLIAGDKKYPKIDYHAGECTFCADCVDVCEAGAFIVKNRVEAANQKPWGLVAAIADTCMAFQGVACQSCGDNCETRAIRFAYSTAGIAVPVLTLDDCTGCGACVAPCPVNAIKVSENNTQESVANAY